MADWVTARNEACSTASLFAGLRKQVEKDVKTRNTQIAPAESGQAQISVESTSYGFRVVTAWHGSEGEASVGFEPRGERAFHIEGYGIDSPFDVRVARNDLCECVAYVGEMRVDYSDVSRKALERLLFAGQD